MLLSSNERVLIFDRGVLQIKQTKKSDEGEYSCTARNVVHARLSQSASLFVETGWYFCICQHFKKEKKMLKVWFTVFTRV